MRPHSHLPIFSRVGGYFDFASTDKEASVLSVPPHVGRTGNGILAHEGN